MKIEKELNLECSFNLHKRVFGVKFKNRAAISIFKLKKFAHKITGINNIRIDTNLNKFIWENGSRNVPFRLRIRLAKRRFFSSKKTENWIIYISHLKNDFSKKNTTLKREFKLV